MAERALNSGGHLSGITTGLDSLNTQDRRAPQLRSDRSSPAVRAWARRSLATNIAFAAAQRFLRDHRGRDRARTSRPAPRSPSSASKCRPTSSPPASSPSNRASARENLRMGKISQQEFRHLARAAGELHSLPLYIDDTPGLTIAALARPRPAPEAAEGHRPDRRRLSPAAPGHRASASNDNRVQEISEISRGLKQLAKELDVPVIGAVAAQPRGRAARGQAPAIVRPARIRLDRAGRRHRPVHLSRGLLSRRPSSRPTTIPISPRGRRRWSRAYGRAE